ncbi:MULTISPECIES: zeta toxin family protein [Mycobacterium avium complex (MAC)]|uniref:UDP-N-acetylglucosamine kinase n=1 Tax=Mycobacterium marseillense TaxID=701042 RepID=A0ABM7J8A2_9MYCO|nr:MULTISPECIES: zeta toxin family protein [Mycobacterium avium complex (MAC)]ETZ35369.1 zeta toxin family protein [Mycobacterium intracellulare MIN_061107_1834]MCA2276632.1 zeta toxin family protein [Mycobacterium intracellulare]MCA2328265.1 zeta toxin family protein [Mycobacterium intracellulare]MCV7403082.1 zeta toxin family protein [Mycobacterium marseillense]MDM3972985.1 zeta toxin family protein [Mycobacterium marseillense]
MARTKTQPAQIHVLAGVNGAGKSSVVGATIRDKGGQYYNPDEAARDIVAANPGLGQAEANAAAWEQGRRLLQRAIDEGLDFTFETTLGGNTMPALLAEAAKRGLQVHVFYVGLDSADTCIERVRQRVRAGGHDISDADIRRRYRHSLINLVKLLPVLTGLRVYDNSASADPAIGQAPRPVLVLHMDRGRIVGPPDLSSTPAWAKPVVAAALDLARRS